MKKHFFARLLAFTLAFALLTSDTTPVYAYNFNDRSLGNDNQFESIEFSKTENIDLPKAGNEVYEPAKHESSPYDDSDTVRVSIVLEGTPTINAGFSMKDVSLNNSAMTYRNTLKTSQTRIASKIEKSIGTPLDIKRNLTLAANIISANVEYGQIEEIKQISGVKDVVIENKYTLSDTISTSEPATPQIITSSSMIGSSQAWALGYYGAGSKIAIIDTGIAPDHISFDAGAYNYALSENAKEKGMNLEKYKESIDVMTADDISRVQSQLNAENLDASKAYVSDKIPFAYNYAKENHEITHGTSSEHGSHVAGIALANRYVPADGTYKSALDEVHMQGVAPDAQLVVMHVFTNTGAYDSDYMAAIEDAIILDCDSVNLSLTSGNAGSSSAGIYEDILNSIKESGVVVTISAGNNSYWYSSPKNMPNPCNYAEDINMDTVGSPASYRNSLAVASVDNVGNTSAYFTVDDTLNVHFMETKGKNTPISTLYGTHDYILLDSVAVDADGTNLLEKYASKIKGKILFVKRGTSKFFKKMDAAASVGALACVIIDNAPSGIIRMELSDATSTIPCVSISQNDGALIMSQAATDGDCYTGTINFSYSVSTDIYDIKHPCISSFSAWGVPGNLTLKPEISAPGGLIYSVDGSVETGNAYELMSGTSMASPQIAGMAAVLSQYIAENNLSEKTGLSTRQLTNSLLMSTSVPMLEEHEDKTTSLYPVILQGSGLANLGNAISAKSCISMDKNSTFSYDDGKVKAELGDDSERTGNYNWCFYIHNFSDEETEYQLNTVLNTQDIFTEDGISYLDTVTTDLYFKTTYTVNNKTYNVSSRENIDVNLDGISDYDDVQAILDYAVGKSTKISPEADMDKDGNITSYDAYLLLQTFSTEYFKVAPDSTVKVCVNAELTSDCKEYLDSNYINGAYIEGYTFVNSKVNYEGAPNDVDYSVPILGFYGSWTDASMFDKNSVWDTLYDTKTKSSYLGNDYTNGLTVKYQKDAKSRWYMSNPYDNKEFPKEERLAINSDTLLYDFTASFIRNAALVVPAITNTDGKILYKGDFTTKQSAAFYYDNTSYWKNSEPVSFPINKTLNDMGIEDEQDITLGLYAIPEYYADPAANDIDETTFKKLIENDVLGDGASIKYNLRIDNTAPRVNEINKNLLTGLIDIKASDNNYIALLAVTDGNGDFLYSVTPAQEEKGELSTTSIDFDKLKINGDVYVIVADYAGNESTYTIEYDKPQTDYTGKMFAFSASGTRTKANAWNEITIDSLNYDCENQTGTGFDYEASSKITVKAAEYHNGLVYMATDGAIYTAKIDSLDEIQKVASTNLDIIDMAYNYVHNTLYALTSDNQIYTIDEISGATMYTDSISFGSAIANVNAMAIDNDGNTYIAIKDSTGCFYLCNLSNGDLFNMGISSVCNNAYGSMAWDHVSNRLYFAASYDNNDSSSNCLYEINPTTGEARLAAQSETANSKLYVNVSALFIVTPPGSTTIPSGIELDNETLNLIATQTATLTPTVYPWTLIDKDVTWESADESIATVENGIVKGISEGETTITATSISLPAISAKCTVHVLAVPNISTVMHCSIDSDTGKYLSIDFDGDLNIKDSKSAVNGYTAGGMGCGIKYGLYNDTMLVNDDDNKIIFQYRDAEYAPLDIANLPTNVDNNHGGIIYPAENGNLYLFNPNDTDNIRWFEGLFNLCAIAYIGEMTIDATKGHLYMTLDTDGVMEYYFIYYIGNSIFANMYAYKENIQIPGLTLQNASMSYYYDNVTQTEGFFVTEGDSGTLYWIDSNAELDNPVFKLGSVDAGYTCSLLSEYDKIETFNATASAKHTESIDLSCSTNAQEMKCTGILEAVTSKNLGTSNLDVKPQKNASSVDLQENDSIINLSEDDSSMNLSTGSLNAISGTYDDLAIKPANKGASSKYDVLVTLSEDEDVTNGMLKLTYDTDVLRFEGVVGNTPFCAANSTEPGIIDVAYAAEKNIKAGDAIVSFGFNYTKEMQPSTMCAYVVERNSNENIPYEPTVITANNMFCVAIPNQEYTGKAIKPAVKVYDGTKLLENKRDYTIKYINNKNIADKSSEKAPTVIITGKGNYNGTIIENFTIVPMSIDKVTVTGNELNYTGNDIKLKPIVKLGTKTLKLNKDYMLVSADTNESIETVHDEGIHKINIVGIGTYRGSKEIEVIVSKKFFTGSITVAKIPNAKYTGEEIKPALKLSYKGQALATDNFDIEYENNLLPGTAQITITAKPSTEFTGSKTVTFKIVGTSIKSAKPVSKIASRNYNGSVYNPNFMVKLGNKILTKDVDYEVVYSNPIMAGTAKVSIIGINGYTGKATYTYKITPYDVRLFSDNLLKINNSKPIAVEYEKGGSKPIPSITFNGVTVDSKYYTIKYSNTDKVAEAGSPKCPQMKITFKGNFKGNLTVDYTINPQSIANTNVSVSDIVYDSHEYAWKQNTTPVKINGQKITPIVVTDSNGKVLAVGKDYETNVEYFRTADCSENIGNVKTLPAGTTVYVRINGINKYTDSVVSSYRVVSANIATAKIDVASKTYTGKPITLTENEITLKMGETTLIPNTDYVIVKETYKDNINKGTASVTVKGIGNYGGTTQVTFKIKSKLFDLFKR